MNEPCDGSASGSSNRRSPAPKGRSCQRPASPAPKGRSCQRPASPAPKGRSCQRPASPAPKGRSCQRPASPAPKGRSCQRPASPAPKGRSLSKASIPSPEGAVLSKARASRERVQRALTQPWYREAIVGSHKVAALNDVARPPSLAQIGQWRKCHRPSSTVLPGSSGGGAFSAGASMIDEVQRNCVSDTRGIRAVPLGLVGTYGP